MLDPSLKGGMLIKLITFKKSFDKTFTQGQLEYPMLCTEFNNGESREKRDCYSVLLRSSHYKSTFMTDEVKGLRRGRI